ncbi:TPM domain-containing protein [Pseudomonas sp. NY15181]|uniref:TPM domain-containing protein n=1 Tax=Pseudomonas sp. NY15181 TaxID=3400349 RepID=UPI003A84CEF3
MIRLRWLLAALLLCWAALSQAAPVAIPPLGARVTDLTQTLDGTQRTQLESQLAALEQRKGAQLAVLMVPSTGDESIEEYAVRAFEQWKLGRKGVDDGVLLVVAKDDRALRIEVGYGLEGAISDVLAGRIIREQIVPHFRNGDFAGGVQAGVDSLSRLIDGEQLPAPAKAASRDSDTVSLLPLVILMAVIPLLGRLLPFPWMRQRSIPRYALCSATVGLIAAPLGIAGAPGFDSLVDNGLHGLAMALMVYPFFLLPVGLIRFIGGGGGGRGGGSGGGGFRGGGGSSGGGGASGRW